MRRHLYFDIDGVLNTIRVDDAAREAWGPHSFPSLMISYAPRLIEQINDLIARTEGLEVYWLTSWEDDAAWFGEQVGLHGSWDWLWLPAAGPGRGYEWEKFTAIRNHLAETQPDRAVWCDDELRTEPDADTWARDRGILTVSPSNVLLPEHLRQIEEFLNS